MGKSPEGGEGSVGREWPLRAARGHRVGLQGDAGWQLLEGSEHPVVGFVLLLEEERPMGGGVQTHGGAPGPGSDWGVSRHWRNMASDTPSAHSHNAVPSSGAGACHGHPCVWEPAEPPLGLHPRAPSSEGNQRQRHEAFIENKKKKHTPKTNAFRNMLQVPVHCLLLFFFFAGLGGDHM